MVSLLSILIVIIRGFGLLRAESNCVSLSLSLSEESFSVSLLAESLRISVFGVSVSSGLTASSNNCGVPERNRNMKHVSSETSVCVLDVVIILH